MSIYTHICVCLSLSIYIYTHTCVCTYIRYVYAIAIIYNDYFCLHCDGTWTLRASFRLHLRTRPKSLLGFYASFT